MRRASRLVLAVTPRLHLSPFALHVCARQDSAEHCGQSWGSSLNAPAVLGFAESMQGFCNAGRRLDDAALSSACAAANLNVLRIGGWNMCEATWLTKRTL
jgi:hypothetical protein